MLEKLMAYVSGNSPNAHNDVLWKLVKDLWEKGESKASLCKDAQSYWEGKLTQDVPANVYFPKQSHSNCNVVKPIVETKLKNTLDAQFTIAVMPDVGAFYDYTAIKESQSIADIFNDELLNIFKRNNIDAIKEKIGRQGFLCGYGGSRVIWDNKEREDGDVKIEWIKSESLRWGKGAESIKDTPYIAYLIDKSPSDIKNLFARNPDNSFNEEICKQIDEISQIQIGDQQRKQGNSVINYINSTTSSVTAGRAFAEGFAGIQGGKSVQLVCMYLLDDSMYAPEDKDDTEKEAAKLEYTKVYPNGRFIVFALDDKKKLILVDEPMDEDFKNLGNIDVFVTTQNGGLSGQSEISDVMPIQDRINGLFIKYREKVAWDFDTMFVDEDFGCEDNAIIRSGITRVRDLKSGMKTPEVISNNGIQKAQILLETIESLKKSAYEVARVNETMLYGSRQTGTTSGEQVKMLQESPMADIRAIQRNFKDWLISVAEKCLLYISKNYTDQRLIQLSAGIDGAQMARISTNSTEQAYPIGGQVIQPQERYVELLNEAMEVVKVIKFNSDWKFKVECVAGTEIPRSRGEQSALMDKLLTSGMLGDTNDIETREAYLKANDVPNYRAIIAMQKRKEEAEAKKPMNFMEVISNPAMCKGVADFLKAMEGFTQDRATVLQGIGLTGKPDTLLDAPVQETMNQSNPNEIIPILPELVSDDPEHQVKGQAVANLDILNKTAKSAENLTRGQDNGDNPVQVRKEVGSKGR